MGAAGVGVAKLDQSIVPSSFADDAITENVATGAIAEIAAKQSNDNISLD